MDPPGGPNDGPDGSGYSTIDSDAPAPDDDPNEGRLTPTKYRNSTHPYDHSVWHPVDTEGKLCCDSPGCFCHLIDPNWSPNWRNPNSIFCNPYLSFDEYDNFLVGNTFVPVADQTRCGLSIRHPLRTKEFFSTSPELPSTHEGCSCELIPQEHWDKDWEDRR